MPKTRSGKWSVVLIIVMPILFIIGSSLPNIMYETAPASNTLLDDIINRPLLAFSMIAGAGAGISALITGLVAVLQRKERAILVYGSTLVGLAVTLFIIAMFLFPE